MRFIGEYDFLSNMHPCPVHYGTETFPCVETAFQFQKSVETKDKERFVTKDAQWIDGYTAKKIGRQVKLREDWNDERIVVMYKLLEDKFYNNKKMRQLLKETGNIYIAEENDWGDTFWGVCNGKGSNILGKMLMEIRQNIQDEERTVKKVIVAGSRSFNDYKLLKERLDYYFSNVKPIIVCGEAKGADTLGKRYAEEKGYDVMSFPADWSKGKHAGYLRNEEMAKEADMLVAFWNGTSRGTEHMIKTMKKLGKPVRVVNFNGHG